MLPVASIDVTNVFDITDTNDIQRVSLKNVDAYSGTFFNQIFNMISVSNKIGRTKNHVRKNEYLEPMQTNLCIYSKLSEA